ncbi:wlm domain containing protein [Phlyctema vagabunda]|uniref:Wlm domain containing protein n=1 Tax=Phlyctema vagabunda TaxID=108571 RepID=A0ABR4P7B9_9HELO
MPLGYERINEKRSSPNKNIVFIKPRPGPEEALSKGFLERIAAQCTPIMTRHCLAVVSLEEYEPNLEFWGRNFNNGEVIQLVLKSPSTGRWLPFRFVQMIMMHELAHCKQMNHSAAFWKVRNELSFEMKALWARDYTGDGLWGRGLLLENGAFSQCELGNDEILPGTMCGGTFKSRRNKKRKLRPKITYKEQQERKIQKKFGSNGMTLGADEEVKTKLEKGKNGSGKPRVAGSARGRDLRAAAALARFENEKENELVADSGTESDDEKGVPTESDALDIDGSKLLDSDGHGMIKVCEDEEPSSSFDAQNELSELQHLHSKSSKTSQDRSLVVSSDDAAEPLVKKEMPTKADSLTASKATDVEKAPPRRYLSIVGVSSKTPAVAQASTHATGSTTGIREAVASSMPCPVCSTSNLTTAIICAGCLSVLEVGLPGSWRCKSTICAASNFINAEDYGICQVCGSRKEHC